MEIFKILLMISNYFHDLSVAVLASNILVVYFLGRFLDQHQSKGILLPHIFKKLSLVTYIAFAWVILGGAVRAYFFMDFEWNPAVGQGQIAALIAKHIILVSVTVIGLVLHIKYQRKYGQNT